LSGVKRTGIFVLLVTVRKLHPSDGSTKIISITNDTQAYIKFGPFTLCFMSTWQIVVTGSGRNYNQVIVGAHVNVIDSRNG